MKVRLSSQGSFETHTISPLDSCMDHASKSWRALPCTGWLVAWALFNHITARPTLSAGTAALFSPREEGLSTVYTYSVQYDHPYFIRTVVNQMEGVIILVYSKVGNVSENRVSRQGQQMGGKVKAIRGVKVIRPALVLS